MPNFYNLASGGPAFSSNAPMRPPPRMLGSSDISSLSPTEVYRRPHEVTASIIKSISLLSKVGKRIKGKSFQVHIIMKIKKKRRRRKKDKELNVKSDQEQKKEKSRRSVNSAYVVDEITLDTMVSSTR